MKELYDVFKSCLVFPVFCQSVVSLYYELTEDGFFCGYLSRHLRKRKGERRKGEEWGGRGEEE